MLTFGKGALNLNTFVFAPSYSQCTQFSENKFLLRAIHSLFLSTKISLLIHCKKIVKTFSSRGHIVANFVGGCTDQVVGCSEALLLL